MSESPTFWQRNSGAALLGVAAYLIVTPAFGFSIDHEFTYGHGATPTEEEPPGFLEDLPLVGDQITELVEPRTSLISSAVDGVNDALASHGFQIALPDPVGQLTDLADPTVDEVGDLLGNQLEALELHGTQIDLESPGSIALVGELIDLATGGAETPSPPSQLVVQPPHTVGVIVGNAIKAIESRNPVDTDEIDTFDIDVVPGVIF